ncbi:MAG: hypothetical protein NVSMB43_05790 [Pseudarthrobacter sp.]
MCCSGVRGDDQPRRRDAGRELPQPEAAGRHGAAGQSGLAADFQCALPLLATPCENYPMAAFGKTPRHHGKPLCRPKPAGKCSSHMDHGCAGTRHRARGNPQRNIRGIGGYPMPLQKERPPRALVKVFHPVRPVHSVAAVPDDHPGAGRLQQACALRAFAVQVDGNVHSPVREGKRLIQSVGGQQFIAAHQLNGIGQPFGGRVEQAMPWKGPLQGMQGGNGHQQIAEAKRAEHQELRFGTFLFLPLTRHHAAFPSIAAPLCPGDRGTFEESIPAKSPAPCLGAAVPGNYVRMGSSETPQLKAVLFDRDGTLVVDVPYNSDPGLVRAMPEAKRVLDSLRKRGLAVGVLSNQSGIARGILTEADVASVNAKVEELLGPFDVWEVCPHGDADGCPCRKPAPGMVHSACRRLGIHPAEAALIGDIGSDVRAAEAAGATGVLVPTPVTRSEEITAAKLVARDLAGAVDLLLGDS